MAMLKFYKEKNIRLFTYETLIGGILLDQYFKEGKKGFFGNLKFTTSYINTSSLKMYWHIVQEEGSKDYWRRLLSTLGKIAASKQISILPIVVKWTKYQGLCILLLV